MRFLADENVPGNVVSSLRNAGHDVVWVRADMPGCSDQDVLTRAESEARIVLTFDKDFGELAWRAALPAACGIILFRLGMPAVAEVGERLASIVGGRDDWAGHFSVVEPGRVRMRKLPQR